MPNSPARKWSFHPFKPKRLGSAAFPFKIELA